MRHIHGNFMRSVWSGKTKTTADYAEGADTSRAASGNCIGTATWTYNAQTVLLKSSTGRGHKDGTATIHPSGFPPRNVPNSIRRPWGFSQYQSGETSNNQTYGQLSGPASVASGSSAGRGVTLRPFLALKHWDGNSIRSEPPLLTVREVA